MTNQMSRKISEHLVNINNK